MNRLYARVRNVGGTPASDVVVNFESTDPPGLGISGAAGWKSLGTLTSAQFPDLATIDSGEFVEWTPDVPPPESGLDAGLFAFHTCLRVTLDKVAGETVFGNQDGDMEQENIFYFEVPAAPGPEPVYDAVIHLRNDDLVERRFFVLDWQSNLPQGWKVSVNKGDLGLELGPATWSISPSSSSQT